MNSKLALYLIFTFILPQFSTGQTETYTIKKASFSSDKYDEFSPVFYKNGIVFCTNRNRGLSKQSTSENKGVFKINYIDTAGSAKWRKAGLLSKSLKTKLNDGPVTFNAKGDTIYYSRNQKVDGKFGDLSTARNKLGIFNAVYDGKKWIKIRELRINNEWYNVSTPWLSPDGKRLYFASDKPGGYGGSDLYYSQWKGDYWDNPVNLGPEINTNGNEAYPFINPAGELFFSSDGHPGLGGKDIFFSRYADTAWLPPVRLDPPINSQYDDFSIITDTLMEKGYFASNRNRSIDIYHFTTNFPQIFYCKNQRINQYCFRFSDTDSINIDPSKLQYAWDFGDGKKTNGDIVEHCFPGPGEYIVKQSVTERKSEKFIFLKLLYGLEIKDIEQPFITSPDIALVGDEVDFNGLKSNLPGYEVLGYTWDIGDSTRVNGNSLNHTFIKPGEYNIKLGVKLRNISTGIINQSSVSKKITICKDDQEMASLNVRAKGKSTKKINITEYDHAHIDVRYSAVNDIRNDAVFQVELMSSKERIDLNGYNFKRLGQKYFIREVLLKEAGLYSYVVREELTLMAAYPALTDVVAMGFKDARIKTTLHSDPAEKELNILKKVYGLSADAFFEKGNFRISQSGFALLDQIATLMKKYPGVNLIIEVHSDEVGTDLFNMNMSEKRAQAMAGYLSGRSIDATRLTARGFGKLSPIIPGDSEVIRKMNRRVQFQFIY